MEQEGYAGFDKKLSAANASLKAANIRASIKRVDRRLWLRATLPPKPHIPITRDNYQQCIRLGVNANDAGLDFAKKKARLLGVQLDSGTFTWSLWIEPLPVAPCPLPHEPPPKTIGQWIEEYEVDYWQKNKATPDRLETWKRDQGLVFRHLPHHEPMKVDILINSINRTEPDSRTRKRYANYCYSLAKFAQLEGAARIKELQGRYSTKSVDPRFLPTDRQIAQWRSQITDPHWRFIYSLIATYGLRGHEVYLTDFSKFPILWVLDGKTGSRLVMPLYPEWAEEWHLDNVLLPEFDPALPHIKLGAKISSWFQRAKCPWSAYDLRHAFVRRCFEFGLPPDWGAKLCGHSTQIHTSVYHAWIDEKTYQEVFYKIIYRSDRPSPPT